VGEDSSVGIATRYALDGPGIEFCWGARFYAPIQIGPVAHLAFYTMGTGSSPGVKRPGSGVDHPSPSSAEVKEGVELYLFSLSGPSWPVLMWTLPFYQGSSCNARCMSPYAAGKWLWILKSLEMIKCSHNTLTSRSRVLFEQLIVPLPVKKRPAFCGTVRISTACTTARKLSLSWAISIRSFPSYSLYHPELFLSLPCMQHYNSVALPVAACT